MKLRHDEQQPSSGDGEFDPIGVIVMALRKRFGGDAMAVAQLQSTNAQAESALQWSAIVSRLSL